jgi:hypothetical protein
MRALATQIRGLHRTAVSETAAEEAARNLAGRDKKWW